ncbi:MAG: HAD family hydrolase [Oscillospiraceae bacterium]|nr:HAD family hydrolase [Oscillospiraceae bacterium]
MKAVIFDLFETLVTEWGKPKYLSRNVAADLGVELAQYRREWRKLERSRFIGEYPNVEQVLQAVLDNLGEMRDESLLRAIAEKRKHAKQQCFVAIIEMLSVLKSDGYKIGLISNCSPEEVCGLRDCALYSYFDAVVLSCEVGMVKPEKNIYAHGCALLGEDARGCYFVGDGGSDELRGAADAGMVPLRALWFIKHYKEDYNANKDFLAFDEPQDMLAYLR